MAAFDIFILKRKGAVADYSDECILKAESYFKDLSKEESEILTKTILKGLPGAEESYSLMDFKLAIQQYVGIGPEKLRNHLKNFLHEVIPVAEEYGIKMAIHPDDPPWPIFGLPRIVSTMDDLKNIVSVVDSASNGITMCSGSLGAGYFNDVPSISKELAHRINFAHLRNVSRNRELNFTEAYLHEGEVNMKKVITVIERELLNRKAEGRTDWQLPIRPDHGNRLKSEKKQDYQPGYSLSGRLKGLKEIKELVADILID
jgi:mannonate dehydratase